MVILLASLSGFLLNASFEPIGIWWIAPLAIALLLLCLESSSIAWRATSLFVFGLSFFGPLLHWTSTYVGVIPWISLTILESLFFIPLALIARIRSWRVFLFPSAWLVLEGLRSRFPFGGFGWGRLAFGQADASYAPLAAIGGAALLSFFVALLGVFLYLAIRSEIKMTQSAAAVLLMLFASTLLVQNGERVPAFSIVAIQGGVPTLGLDFNSRATAVFRNHLVATEKYLQSLPDSTKRPNLILWPENSVDVDPFRSVAVSRQLQNLVDKYRVPILLGAVLDKGAYLENASILWEPQAGATSVYIKQHLTPFGEYMPLRKLAEFVSPYAKRVTDFHPGGATVVHRVDSASIAAIICYELLDDQLGREMSAQSNLLVVQTNSATFGTSAQSAQQLGITRIRAIEHQREVVSVATAGISAVIDASGRVSQQSRLNRVEILEAKVSLNAKTSIADRLGSRVEWVLALLPLLAWLIVSSMGKSSNNKDKKNKRRRIW